MGGRGCNVLGCHPGFLVGTVELVAIQRDIGRDHETISVVGCDGHLNLCQGHGADAFNRVDLRAIGDALATLGRPDQQALIGVDIARDGAEGECCHCCRR